VLERTDDHQRILIFNTSTPFSDMPMRIPMFIAGVLCCAVGVVWILQGIDVLPGSFMTGHVKWAMYGGFLLIAGVGLLVAGKRRRI